MRAYHGDYIPEQIFKRWYLPATLPDVRPKRAERGKGDDLGMLEDYARRKKKEKDYEGEVDKKGMAPVGSLMFGEVERRIDVLVFRCCFAHSIYEARRLVIHGDVMLNGKKVGFLGLFRALISYSNVFVIASECQYTASARRHDICQPQSYPIFPTPRKTTGHRRKRLQKRPQGSHPLLPPQVRGAMALHPRVH